MSEATEIIKQPSTLKCPECGLTASSEAPPDRYRCPNGHYWKSVSMDSAKERELVDSLVDIAFDSCNCYGHLCGHCDDARWVITYRIIEHFHVARYDNGKLTDRCLKCSFDIRDEIHRRI